MNLGDFEERIGKIRNVYEKRLFFISGTPKSGTTWLQKMLNAHPEILCAGEGHFMDCFGYFLHQAIGIYNTQQQVVGEHVYDGEPYYKQITVNDFGFLFRAFVGIVLGNREIPDTVRCIGDKTPIHALHLAALKRFFPEAKFLHIIRDGRDVAVSTIYHQARLVPQGELPSITESTKAVAERWVKFNEAAFDFGKQHPESFHAVTYCNLQHNFEETFAAILQFLEVDDSPAAIRQCQEAAHFSRLSGGRQPGQEDPKSFYRKGVTGDWQNHLDAEHQALFESIAGDMLRSLRFA